jgi:hypothetical protein
MRWKRPVEPKIGDEKTDVRFAFFPTPTDDGYTVWLEWYISRLRYETQEVATRGGWVPKTRWFEVKTELYNI